MSGTQGTLTPGVTVVVATRNRWPDLRECLSRHEARVVLVDNASTDGTPELIRRYFPEVQVIALERNVGAVARNIGVAAAETDCVAFADDDSWWSPGSLARGVQLMEAHPTVGLLAARILVGPEERLDPTCVAMRDSPLGTEPGLPGPSVLGFVACGALVRTSAFRQAGGFDEVVFFMGEEERLALDLASLGWSLCYVDRLSVHHHPSPARDGRDRRARIARNQVLTAVLRRPWPVVLSTTATAARSGPDGRRGVVDAARAVPRALAARRTIPARVEEARRCLG